MSRNRILLVAALLFALASTACKNEQPGARGEGAATAEGAATEEAAAATGHQYDPDDRWSLSDSPVKGAEDALVTIVEFSEFQCPFCSRVNPTLQQILDNEEFAGKVRVVFKHLPLDFHDRAEPAARASRAAQLQGKFWEYHDLLFQNQRALTDENLTAYAEQVGLDLERFAADYASEETRAFVANDLAVATRLGIRGTPNFMINGRALAGAQPFEQFATIIREEITATQALVDGGQSLSAAYASRLDTNLAAAPAPQEQQQRQRPAEPDPNAEMYIPIGDSPVHGGANALVTIAIFSEFQCPYCNRVRPTLDQVLAEYGDDVRIVFKHRPLGFHDRAEPAARAAIAAQNQEKFWEFHDLLFDNMRDLSDEAFIRHAEQLGLNIEQFRADMTSETTTQRIAADTELADRVAARGTPHFFINGYRLRGAQPFEAFKAQIDRRLEEARAAIAGGAARNTIYDTLQADAVRGPAPMIQPSGGDAPAAAPAAPAAPVQINVDGAPFLGGENASVVLVEYSDFTCGYCIRFHSTLHEVAEHYGDRVRIVFKQFPRGNPDLAIAALAAHNQGKFWEMADLIFENRPNGREGVEAYGQQLGLDMDRFRSDLDDPATRERAMAERQEGAGFGVRGTPTWFLNGVQHVGAMDAARVRQLIDAQLQ